MLFDCLSFVYLLAQEMYEKTPLSRGKSLDPNPYGPGQFIQHKYRALSCRNGMNMFPMLNVRSHCLISVSNVCHIFNFIEKNKLRSVFFSGIIFYHVY